MKTLEKFQLILVITIYVLLILCIIAGCGTKISHTDAGFSFSKFLLFYSFLLLSILTVIATFGYIDFFAKILILGNGFLFWGVAHFFTLRNYFKTQFIILFVCAIYLIISLKPQKEYESDYPGRRNGPLISGVFPIVFACAGYLTQCFLLSSIIEMRKDDMISGAAIVSCVITMIVVILYCSRSNKKSKSKNSVKTTVAVIFGTLTISVLVIFGTLCSINYTFDTSEPIKVSYKISDKYRSSSTRSTYYKITIDCDWKENELLVTRRIFDKYEVGDTITMYLCDGALKHDYYEFTAE